MKKTILILSVGVALFMIPTKTCAQQVKNSNLLAMEEKETTNDLSNEYDELKKLIEETFVNGALNNLNTEAMYKGFHQGFAILIANNNKLNRLFLNDWIKLIEQYKNSEEQVKSGVRNLDCTINVIDVTGKTAIVKTEFFRNNTLVITDYLSFIKFPDGWKAVGKISHEHISNPLNLKI